MNRYDHVVRVESTESCRRPRRLSRRLTGCIAIGLICAAGLAAAEFEYRAGTAAVGQVKALALEDRRGNRAAIAQAEFAVTSRISDLAALRLMKDFGMDRGAILLRSNGPATAAGDPQQLADAVTAAFLALDPAALRFRDGALSVESAARQVALLGADGGLHLGDAAPGAGGKPATLVRAPIRTAFRGIDLNQGLRKRGEPARVYYVQAIALGKEAAILGLSGPAPAAGFRAKGLIVAPYSNDGAPFPDEPRVRAAIRQLLARVGHYTPAQN
jgi:hypothetical protein